MNDIVISAKNLKKVYRLYAKPSYRFLDMFGMLGNRPAAYTEHAALDGVDLQIERGEKVGIIGRNGAGKSTLLKLITNVIEPTSGTLDVQGKVHALLQIGTGFHPDFTGRENVHAYLAQLGITGGDAQRLAADVIEFAEIEEYIDQPVKTYSTGMAVRLMFSASTAISPDLLVLDEVLGVGDAYFAQKSYDRMRDLCDRNGATLLLVTHDIYSAAKMCSRLVWIDRGRVLMDSDGSSVVKAYEDSIRQQEESRLRARKQERLKAARREALERKASHVIVEIQSRDNQPQQAPTYFSRIALTLKGEVIAELPLGANAFEAETLSHLQREGSSWGDAVHVHGRDARPLKHYGSPFHKVVGVFASAAHPADLRREALGLEIDYRSDAPADLLLTVFVGSERIPFGRLPPPAGDWTTYAAAPVRDESESFAEINTTGVHGTGAVVIADVELLDETGRASSFVTHGRPATFAISVRVVDRALNECPQVILVMFRDGAPVARFVARTLKFDGARVGEARVMLHLPSMMLGIGVYSVAVMIAEEGYLDREQPVFYTLNPGVYATQIRVLEFHVTGEGLAATNTVFVGEGEWSLQPAGSHAG